MNFISKVLYERQRQDDRWGEQNHPDGLGGEAFRRWEISMKQQNEAAVAEGRLTWSLILREEVAEALAASTDHQIQGELVQVAAVCQAWHEAIERRKRG